MPAGCAHGVPSSTGWSCRRPKHEPLPEGFRIEREPSGAFRVVGRPAERTVALSDITTPDAQEYVRSRLQRLGVDRALERAGAREGDTVHIGDMEFEYQADGVR